MLLAEPVVIATPAPVRGELRVPPAPAGLIICIDGSGLTAGDASLRDAFLAEGLAVLHVRPFAGRRDPWPLSDLQEPDLLGHRVSAVVDWCATRSPVSAVPVGLYGAGTGAAAALVAAAGRPASVGAVVARAGRPDRVAPVLARVLAPTLLLVLADDEDVLDANEGSMRQFGGVVQLEVIAAADEGQFSGREAAAAVGWFRRHLASPGASAAVVPVPEWTAFLEGFTGRHRGCLVAVTAERSGPDRAAGAGRPLGAIRAIVDRDHVVAIEVIFADCQLPFAVSVIGPAVVRAYETARGTECALEIEDRYGVRTSVAVGPSRMRQDAADRVQSCSAGVR